MLAVSAFAPSAVLASHVQPIPISSGNPTCDDFAAEFGGTWTEFKLQGADLADGTYTDGTLEVTISNFVGSDSGTPGSFDWSSNIGVDAVFVKAGTSKHNLYVYDPESTGDTDLGPQAGTGNGISHISFCYDEDAPPTPTPTPTPTAPPTPTPTPTLPPTPTPTLPPTPTPVVPPTPTGSELPAASERPTPSGQVGGVIGTPNVTPPTTDALSDATSLTSGSWRIVLASLAGVIVLALVFTQPSRARRER
jgi:hypothetical protein